MIDSMVKTVKPCVLVTEAMSRPRLMNQSSPFHQSRPAQNLPFIRKITNQFLLVNGSTHSERCDACDWRMRCTNREPSDALMCARAHAIAKRIYSLLSAQMARHKLSAFYFVPIYRLFIFRFFVPFRFVSWKWSMGYDLMQWENLWMIIKITWICALHERCCAFAALFAAVWDVSDTLMLSIVLIAHSC